MIIKIADPKSNQFIMALVVVTQICVRMYSTAKSCLTPCNPIGCSHQAPLSMGLSRQKYWSGCHFLRQGIFPTQGLNPRLPHCRWILYCLSHHGSTRILGWVAYPFYRASSGSRNRTGVSCIVRGFFTTWSTREARFRGGWCSESSNYQCWWTYSQILVSIKGTTFLGDVKNTYTPSESKISLLTFYSKK